jgi:hypothetical protein
MTVQRASVSYHLARANPSTLILRAALCFGVQVLAA